MTLWAGAAWLPWALLLLQVPGSLSLRGPSTVTGTVGGSLKVQCRYEEKYTEHRKYWCKSPCFPLTRIAETTEPEREVRRGRVSIRDHPANLTFTVTLDSLTEDDGDTYGCGIAISWGRDIIFRVRVSVVPGPTEAPSPEICTSSLGPPSSLPVTTWPDMTGRETRDPSQQPRSLLSSVHFLLLVFLELPLLLSMLSAVLWVNMPQKNSGGEAESAG